MFFFLWRLELTSDELRETLWHGRDGAEPGLFGGAGADVFGDESVHFGPGPELSVLLHGGVGLGAVVLAQQQRVAGQGADQHALLLLVGHVAVVEEAVVDVAEDLNAAKGDGVGQFRVVGETGAETARRLAGRRRVRVALRRVPNAHQLLELRRQIAAQFRRQ